MTRERTSLAGHNTSELRSSAMMRTRRDTFDACTYVTLLLDFDDHELTIALDSRGKSHATKTQEQFRWAQRWLADRTERRQMALADTAGNISAGHVSGVSRTGGGHACLSSETKPQWPLPG